MTPARRNVSRVSTCDAKSYLACPARPTFPLHSDPHAPNSIKVGLRASHFRIQNTKVFNPCCFDGNCTVKYKAAFAFADGPNQYGWAVENAKPTTSKREPSKHACIIDGEKGPASEREHTLGTQGARAWCMLPSYLHRTCIRSPAPSTNCHATGLAKLRSETVAKLKDALNPCCYLYCMLSYILYDCRAKGRKSFGTALIITGY
ncbi:hypothetical protein B0I75DRAFT_40401 [Yarrowia lipolytica]|nr:hypothetical protein B0I74DRAFT_40877 [Yarrowia lipolytica]RDW55274.1 hypothetical protein B0I75DRAFT_40401 [Yarrowia lipolytica]